MDAKLKRKVAIGAAGLAVVASGGIAYAATQDPGAADRQAILSDAAKRLNVSPDQLNSALQGAYSDQIDKALASGRITQPQADKLKQALKDNGVPFGVGTHGGGFFFRERGFAIGGPFSGGLGAAAKYLGLSRSALASRLRSGKSLADVAKAQGKSVTGLVSAIKDAVKTRLDQAVAAKKITSAEEQELDAAISGVVQGDAGSWAGPRHKLFVPPPAPTAPGAPKNGSSLTVPQVTMS